MVQCDKTNRRKTLDEFALEAEGNEEEASLSLFDFVVGVAQGALAGAEGRRGFRHDSADTRLTLRVRKAAV